MTAVHEFGHVVMAVALGGRVPRVRLWRDTSGLTTWRSSESGRIRSTVIALAGHTTPAAVGAACAAALASGRSVVALVGLTALVGVVTIAVRNLWGFAVCVALAALCWWAWVGGAGTAEALVAGSAGVLCLGAVRASAEELATNRKGGHSDTQVAASSTKVPAVVWGIVLVAWATACTAWSAVQVVGSL